MQKYLIKKISNESALKIWDQSSNATIFTNPKFLKLFKDDFIWLSALKGNEEICAWPILEKKKDLIIPNFFYYFGPIWKNLEDVQNHSWLSLSTNIYELFLDYFEKNYNSVNFQLNYHLDDVRAFSWWKYGKKIGRYNVEPKYTALIENLDKKNENDILSDFRYWRRREVKLFLKKNNLIETNQIQLSEMINLYEKIVYKNKENLNKEIKINLEDFFNAVKNGLGAFICFRDKKTNSLESFSLILFDKNSAHLVLSLTDQKYKKNGLAAFNIFKSIMFSKKNKKKIFDFNGANSPDRGDDKHSYGSKHKLFFEIYKK